MQQESLPPDASNPLESRPSIRSGLHMLLAVNRKAFIESPEQRWARFKQRVGASSDTWMLWGKREELLACEGLALHHHCDPNRLGMNDPGSGVFDAIYEEFGDPKGVSILELPPQNGRPPPPTTTGQWMEWFMLHLIRLEQCFRYGGYLERAKPVWASKVRREDLNQWMAAWEVFPADCADFAGSPVPQHKTRLRKVQAVLDADALSRSVDEGGTYVPGAPSTYPDVDAYLRKHYSDLKATARGQIRSFVRPPELPMGRPKRKAG